MIDWSKVFTDALPFTSFLDRYATPAQRSRWDAMHGRSALTAEQVRHWTRTEQRVPSALRESLVRLARALAGPPRSR